MIRHPGNDSTWPAGRSSCPLAASPRPNCYSCRSVASYMRVRGVDNLRVVDCSVLPTMVSGNLNGPIMAMAWHGADLMPTRRDPPTRRHHGSPRDTHTPCRSRSESGGSPARDTSLSPEGTKV
ncbi:GMC oxidoreductase [Sphaerisporangium perillae]|uniref:GMC oxidoreductase n=1 Tax=Sphaerisporangium perillae TaxID=2935860 RepID=UPI00200BA62E|nr:GMC oxidoreductase [Sphaerisporangium perillae]